MILYPAEVPLQIPTFLGPIPKSTGIHQPRISNPIWIESFTLKISGHIPSSFPIDVIV